MARGLGRCGMKDDGERNQARDGVLRRGHGQDPADPDAGEAGERRGRMDPWVDRAGRRLRSVESSRSTGLRMHASMGACAAAGTSRRRGAVVGLVALKLRTMVGGRMGWMDWGAARLVDLDRGGIPRGATKRWRREDGDGTAGLGLG